VWDANGISNGLDKLGGATFRCVVGATHLNGNEKSFGMRVEGIVVTG